MSQSDSALVTIVLYQVSFQVTKHQRKFGVFQYILRGRTEKKISLKLPFVYFFMLTITVVKGQVKMGRIILGTLQSI